jgi:nucleoside-diphosphate-sugar epimerase
MSVAGVRKFINTGTSWQHYNNEKYNPVCLYAATKQAFESLLEYYVEVVSFKAVTLELFDTYGENDTRPKLINLLHKISDDHIELNMSPGEQELNLIHISDVCNAYDKAIEMIENDFTENKHLKFDVSSDEVYKLKDIIDLFEKTSGKTINVVWGGRPYRKREVMNVWSGGNRLTNWKAKVKLSEGLKKYKG